MLKILESLLATSTVFKEIKCVQYEMWLPRLNLYVKKMILGPSDKFSTVFNEIGKNFRKFIAVGWFYLEIDRLLFKKMKWHTSIWLCFKSKKLTYIKCFDITKDMLKPHKPA